MSRLRMLLACLLVPCAASFAQAPSTHPVPAVATPVSATRVLTHREQNTRIQERLEHRFATVLPALMRRTGIDMWLVISREYNDDPVFRSLAPFSTYSSRRRTILVFHDRGGDRGVERISVGRFSYDDLYTVYPTHNDSQWVGLRKLIEERKPKVIGVNMSETWSHADGLSANERDNLLRALGPEWSKRVRSAEQLSVGWLEAKLPEEASDYRHVMRFAHGIIAEAFSNEVIVPGVTTTEDVVWWMRQRVADYGFGQWFQPSVTIWRRSGVVSDTVPPDRRVIQRGDMLHCDFGLVYLNLFTDTQHLAYVLLPGESEAPAGLRAGLAAANRLQDIAMTESKAGVTGNAALAAARKRAISEGITPSIYTHPIGYHGHGAGTTLGMTDYQQGVPGSGDYPFHSNTWYSIELNATHRVPEWGGTPVRFALEEDAMLTDDGWEWVLGRQSDFYLIR
ncbi:MAG TPA: M24 family metallopeptidase [Gemmatimonadaceae bacterium]|nr:M24 family metallopeptidase [Gemmatimonadaceae bacterium]